MSEITSPLPQSDAAVSESDLRLAIGPNADGYVAAELRRQRWGHWALPGWNWWGLLMPIPWLYYRKLWVVGSALLLLPILVQAQVGTGGKAGFALMVVIAAFGKPLVLDRAKRLLRRISLSNLSPAEAAERLRCAGGVSPLGALLGCLLTLSYIGLVFGFHLPSPLPACQAPPVVRMVLEIAEENLATNPELANAAISLRNGRQASGGTDSGRHCVGEIEAGSLKLPINYYITWQSQARNIIAVELTSRAQAERLEAPTP